MFFRIDGFVIKTMTKTVRRCIMYFSFFLFLPMAIPVELFSYSHVQYSLGVADYSDDGGR